MTPKPHLPAPRPIPFLSILSFSLISLLPIHSSNCFAKDEFDQVKCGTNIPKAVIGRKIGKRGKLQSTELAHQSIGLRGLGAHGVKGEDPYFLIFWEICKEEYVFVVDQTKDHDLIKDVLPIPSEVKGYPQGLTGTPCERNGKKVNDSIFAILEKEPNVQKAPVRKAWRLDQTSLKFHDFSVEGLTCNRY